jgi:hypothetical protein
MNAYDIGAKHLSLAERSVTHSTAGVANVCRLPISNHFPPVVRDALVRAAQTPLNQLDPLVRVRAINQAIRRARLTFPELFRPDEVIE